MTYTTTSNASTFLNGARTNFAEATKALEKDQTDQALTLLTKADELSTAGMTSLSNAIATDQYYFDKQADQTNSNIDNIRKIEQDIHADLGDYNSFVEFNQRTTTQINNLHLQLKVLVTIDVLLAIGVGVMTLKWMGKSGALE